MKRITSSLLALLLALSMLIGMVPVAYAAQADTIESINSTETVDSTETEDVSDESEDVAAQAADEENSEPQTLAEMVYAASEGETITLPAGTYVIPSGVETGKTVPTGLTIVGAAAGVTTVEIQGITPGESSGTYFFDGQKAVTFKDLTIDFGPATDYDGFVRAGDMTFENVTIKGMGSHWGKGAVKFTKCSFVYPDEGYNEWTYNLWTYSGSSFEFKDCNFSAKLGGGNETNPARGKFVNVYSQATEGTVSVSLDTCKFKTEKEDGTTVTANKPILKIGNGSAWNISMTNIDITEAEAATDETTGSKLYGSSSGEGILRTDSTSVPINGTTDWKNGAKAEPTGVAKIGDTGYDTLAAAVTAANPGDTITLLDNIELTSAQSISRQLTIDLNGKTITSSAIYTIKLNKGADLTVKDSATGGKIANTHSSDAQTIYLYASNTTFTLESGTIESTPNENTIYSVAIANYSGKKCVVNIKGGNVVTPEAATNGRAITAANGMTLNISGGKITGGFYGVAGFASSTTTITGGKISARIVDSGLTYDTYAIFLRYNGANVIVKDGTVCGIKVEGYSSGADTFPTVTLEGGTIDGSITHNGQKWHYFKLDVPTTSTTIFTNETAKDFLPDTVQLKKNEDGTYGITAAKKYVAEIKGGNKYETLDAAFEAANDNDEIIINAGTYEMGDLSKLASKTVTVSAATGAEVVFDNAGAVGMSSANVTFNGITFDYMPNHNYTGLQHAGNMVYNNCVFNGMVFLYGTSETFNTCKFNQTEEGAYNVWTYTGENVSFNNCEFTCYGRCVYIYNEGGLGEKVQTVSFVNSTFEAKKTVSGKAAIEISTELMGASATVAVDNKTAETGFATDTKSGSSLWNVKKTKEDTTAGGEKNATITVAGTQVFGPASNVASIDGNGYETLDAAITAARTNDVITLIDNVTATATVTVPADKTITLDLNGKTYTSSEDGISNAGTLTIKDSAGAGKLVATGKYSNAIENKGKLTIENGSYEAVYGAVRALGGSNTTIKGGAFSSSTDRYSMYYWANKVALTVTVEGGTFKNSVSTAMENGNVTLAVKGGTFTNDLSAYCETGYATNLDSETGLYVYGKTQIPSGYVEDENGNVTISDEEGLFWFAKQVNEMGNNFSGKTVKLTNNIDLSGKTWKPVGNPTSFSGTFDGQNHTIDNLSTTWAMAKAGYGLGFFFSVTGGTVKNVTFKNAKIDGENRINVVGIVTGYTYGNPTFENVHVTDSCVYGFGKVGGMVGMAAEPGKTITIKNCTVINTQIKATYNVADFCGNSQGPCSISGSTLSGNSFEFIQSGGFGPIENLSTTVTCTGDVASCAGNGTVIKGSYTKNNSNGCYYSAYSELYNRYGNEKHDCTLADGKKLANSEVTHDAPVELNGVKYSDLQAAFDAVKTGDTINILADITLDTPATCYVNGITLEGNNHTITCNTATGDTLNTTGKTAISFGGKKGNTEVYCTGVTVQNLNMTGKARFALYFHGGSVSTLTNVNISGSYWYAINLFGTHGATLNNCNVSNDANLDSDNEGGAAIWANVASQCPLTLNDSKVSIIGINKYTAANTLAPKIFVMGTSETEIHTLDDGKVSGNKKLCVSTTSTGTYTIKEYDSTTGKWVEVKDAVASVNGTTFETLVDAITAAVDGDTVKLLADTTEDVVINKDITLDLNGFTLTNEGAKHTITVNEGVSLTIEDSVGTGTVDNVTHGCGALVNNGTVILSGGTFERSAEKGTLEPYGNGGNSWYTIANYGTMTINNKTTVKNAGGYSSNILNGDKTTTSTLTIEGGTFEGGINTVKNGDCGVLEIKGGELKNTAQYVIMNWHKATISGGTFETAKTADAVLFSSKYDENAEVDLGELTITGGKFTAAEGAKLIDDSYGEYLGTVKIRGGSFNLAVDPKHCDTGFIPTQNADGTYGVKEGTYVAKVDNVKYETLQAAINAAKGGSTVRLLANVTLTETAVFPAGKKVDLNLVGHNITATGTALLINGTTDILSTDGVGTIESTGNVAVAVGNNASLTVYSGTLKGREGAVITGTSTGAKIEIRYNATLIATDNAVIAGNGSKRDGKPNTILVKGSTFIGGIESKGYIACGIYAPWNDNVTVSGGTFNINNGAGIVARAGNVKVTGGTFNCGDGQTYGWVGDSKNEVPNAALVFDKVANYPALTESSQILVSGGTFSTDPAANGAKLADGYVANKDESGMYKVAKSNPVAAINGVKYDTLQAAINAAQATQGGATITLLKNINTESYYTVNGDNPVTIDLAGCNITGSGISGLFYVTAKGDLTIKGEGTVTAVEDNRAAMAVWVRSPSAKVTLEGGTYTQQITNTADPHFDLIYVEYGNVYVKGGTYKGVTPKWTLNCKDENYPKEANIEVTGGTFHGFDPSANPEGKGTTYVKTGYVSTANGDGTYGVKLGTYVAAIGEKKYATLAAAVEAAKDGDTITLIADVEQNTMLVINKDITLDLAGKKIFNTIDIWSDTNKTYELLSIEAKVTITGNGTIDAKENDCYTINVKNGDLTIENGTFYGNVSVVQVENGTLTINGGKFDLHQKWKDKNTYLINCIDDAFVAKTAKVAIYGGEFVDFDPNVSPEKKIDGKAPSFAAPGVGITKNENNTFTAQPNMAAQIMDADGNSVAAYATLKEAVNAAKSGETVIVLKEATVEEMITAEANITIDLNQKTVTVADGAGTMLKTTGDVTIKNGTLTSAVTANIINAYGKLKLESVKIYGSTVDDSNLVNVLGNAEVTIDAASEIEADGVGVAVFVGAKSADKDAKYTLNIYGKVTQKGKSYAISGNGSYPGASYINIYEGAEVKANNIAEKKDCCAIYQPQAGEINVYGGLVEGYCAIVIKSGTLNISGGTVRGIRNDNVLGDNNSAGNGASYDGSAIVVDSRKTGYAGNVKINVTGGTVESYYSTAIREIGNDATKTQLVELTVTGGEILGASKNLTNAENDILVRDISVSNVAISGGTFNHEVQADYCAVGYQPTEKDAETGKYTVKAVDGNVYYMDGDKIVYGDLMTLLNDSEFTGTVYLFKEIKVTSRAVFVDSSVTVDLNGKNLEFTGKLLSFGKVVDSTDGEGLLTVSDMIGSQMPSDNGYLPVKDGTGYRLYQYTMEHWKDGYGIKDNAVKFSVVLKFTNTEAWLKLANDDNSVNLRYVAEWNGNNKVFKFADSMLDSASKLSLTPNQNVFFTMSITGLDRLDSGVAFGMTPILTCAFFTQTLKTVTYTTIGG